MPNLDFSNRGERAHACGKRGQRQQEDRKCSSLALAEWMHFVYFVINVIENFSALLALLWMCVRTSMRTCVWAHCFSRPLRLPLFQPHVKFAFSVAQSSSTCKCSNRLANRAPPSHVAHDNGLPNGFVHSSLQSQLQEAPSSDHGMFGKKGAGCLRDAGGGPVQTYPLL